MRARIGLGGRVFRYIHIYMIVAGPPSPRTGALSPGVLKKVIGIVIIRTIRAFKPSFHFPFPPSPFRSTVITGQPACMANARVTSCCFFGPDGLIYRYGMKITGSREDGERRGEGKREGNMYIYEADKLRDLDLFRFD